MYHKIFLKPHKEKPIQNRHHWIFSGAVQSLPKVEDGDIVEVYSSQSRLLGYAFFNSKSSIVARMINFDKSHPLETIQYNIEKAISLRTDLFKESTTNAYRVINSEGDYLSGLTVDRYASVLVIQISSVGMAKQRDLIVNTLVEGFQKKSIDIKSVFERSTMSAREQEGLPNFEGLIYGEPVDPEIIVLENSIKFSVDVINGQKTGLFLDMREMRKLIGEISANKKVLNCFGYNGGFSLYAQASHSTKTLTLDISKPAIEAAKKNFMLNFNELAANEFVVQDVFDFLETTDLVDFDIIILDPPAFAKKKSDITQAARAYERLNRLAFQKVKSGTLVLTCSCSYHISKENFLEIINNSLKLAGRSGRILSTHRHANDHPINIFHNENDYLKSLLICVG